MKRSFTFKGFCELKRLNGRNIGRVEFEGEESRALIQVGQRKQYDDDVPVKVTIIVERLTKKRS